MTIVRTMLTGFIAGELSPFLSGRIETEQYRYGLETCENWIPTIEGPLVKRAGFAFIREAAATSLWLSAFRRNVTQEYVVEWGENIARFFAAGGRIETAPGVAYEIVTPYPALTAPRLSQQQSYDRLYLADAGHVPSALVRTGALSFAMETLDLRNGPFANPNSDPTVTIQASFTSGSVTLTANTPLFTAGMVGQLVRIEAVDFGAIPQWEAGAKLVTIGQMMHNEGKVYYAASNGTTGTKQPTHSAGTFYDGANRNDLNDKGPLGVLWTYLHDKFGVLRITAFTSATSVTATVERRLPDSVASAPTWRWQMGAFGDAAGWPHLVTLHAGRLIFFKEYDIIGSVVGDFAGGSVNFADYSTVGELAPDLAFRRTISTEDAPLWVAKDRRLIVGTASRELAIGPVNNNAPLAGDNISAEDQSNYGSDAVAPVQMGTETLFVQRGGRRLRAADFDLSRDRYDAVDLTAAARHISGMGGFVQLAFQREPEAMVFAVLGSGQLAVHPKSRLDIKGFARFALGGGARCLSAVSIAAADGRTEELWLLIERLAADGVTTLREIWKQEPPRELGASAAEQFYVDGGVRIEAAAGQRVFSGLTHLAGQAVAVLADGGVVPGITVSGAGVLTLPASSVPSGRAYTVIAGLAFTATAVGLRPNVDIRGMGNSQGLIQRVLKLTLRLIETMGIKVGTPDPADPLEEIIDRPASGDMDAPVPLASGDFGGHVDAEFDTNGQPRWVSDTPLAAVVTAAMLKLEVDAADV